MDREVSVVVPVSNGARFVRTCWQSMRRQTHSPREVIFVDDGSTDDTLGSLQQLAGEWPGVRILSQPAAGPAAARNAGIRETTGAFVAFLDIDDTWPDVALERAMQCFERHPESSVVAGLVQIIWTGQGPPTGSPLRKPHRRVNLGAHVFRAELFARFGLFDSELTYGEDVEYIARLRQGHVRFHQLDEVMLHYHQHGENMTTGRGVHELGLFQALSRSLSRGRVTKVNS